MTHPLEFPNTLQEAMAYFAKPEKALEFMVSMRWPDGKPTCPDCGSTHSSFISTRSKWKCMACHRQYSAKVGTIFEDSALGYEKWFPAMWLICNAKNGISSYELAAALGVTQKTAWFMLHRIRLALQNGSIVKFKGDVEVDETYIGGKARFMHKKDKLRKLGPGGKGSAGKEIVQGLLDRENGKVRLVHVRDSEKNTLDRNVRANVEGGSNVYTDAHSSYVDLGSEFNHEFIDHAETYVDGKVHTNGLENFWSLLKRGLKGTYVSVEPFHLFRYLDEQAFRYNERKDTPQGRFLKAVEGIVGRRIQWQHLIGKGGEDLPREVLA